MQCTGFSKLFSELKSYLFTNLFLIQIRLSLSLFKFASGCSFYLIAKVYIYIV